MKAVGSSIMPPRSELPYQSCNAQGGWQRGHQLQRFYTSIPMSGTNTIQMLQCTSPAAYQCRGLAYFARNGASLVHETRVLLALLIISPAVTVGVLISAICNAYHHVCFHVSRGVLTFAPSQDLCWGVLTWTPFTRPQLASL